MSQAASVHTVTVPVTASGIGPYVPDPPTTLLLDLSQRPDVSPESIAEADEILQQARLEAAAVIERANAEAHAVERAAEEALADARTKAEEITGAAQGDAEQIISQARSEADRLVNEATDRAAELLAEAENEISRLRAETESDLAGLRTASEEDRTVAADELESAQSARTEAETVLAEARKAASALVAEAQESAHRIVETAHQDAEMEAGRIRDGAESELRTSVSTAEERVKDLEAVHQIELATLAEREAGFLERIAELESQLTDARTVARLKEQAREVSSTALEVETVASGPEVETARSAVEDVTAEAADVQASPWLMPDDDFVDSETPEEDDSDEVHLDVTEDADFEDDRDDQTPRTVGHHEDTEQRDSEGRIRPSATLIEPLRPQVFRATATEPSRKKRRRRK